MSTLGSIKVGLDTSSTGNGAGEVIKIESVQRNRGTVMVGQPGSGKTSQLISQQKQCIENGDAVLVVEPHDGIRKLLPHIPPSRWDDVVILSLLHDPVPLWPMLNIENRPEDRQIISAFLFDAWRAQFGDDSVGVRTEEVMNHILELVPSAELSPIELLAAMASEEYRRVLARSKEMSGVDFALHLFFYETVRQIREPGFQEWAQSSHNKLSPLVLHPWLRRATTGTPPATGPTLDPQILDHPDLAAAMWLRDGTVEVRREGSNARYLVDLGNQHLDPHLVEYHGGSTIKSQIWTDGFDVGDREIAVDALDPCLQIPELDELIFGGAVQEHVRRRRRRRGWRRMSDFLLRESRGVRVKEAIDIGQLLDDGRIVLVEVVEVYGRPVTKAVAIYVLMSALLAGTRQLQLPEELRRGVSVFVDEAELFMNKGMDTMLAQLRKADVSLTMAVQRLGQFGPPGSNLRKGIMDNVGTIISLTPGIEEANEIADLLKVKQDDVRSLARGNGLISKFDDKGVRLPTSQFAGIEPKAEGEDGSQRMRRASIERYYQTAEEADIVYKDRVNQISMSMLKDRPAK